MSKAAIGPPSRSLDGFPQTLVDTDLPLYRAGHPAGPWWFNSVGEHTQRFDLPDPHGTCYLATNVETAIREKGRDRLLETGTVPEGIVQNWTVYDLTLPAQVLVADTGHAAAVRFGANRDLVTVLELPVTCAWAAAFHRASFNGIVYATRFTSAQQGWNALALFGDAGVREGWPYTNTRTGSQAMDDAGIGNLISGREGLQIINPPGEAR